MGPYLTVPKKEKDSVDGENGKVSSSALSRGLTLFVAEIRRDWHARLAQHHGGFSHR
jgi:hypothetical protein